ncbi:zinc-ribbon domain-containing protein [Streptomyces toxytricini]|uniref:zinc-ribbon domain-containing protein n=1 Tax=Streptomyces TaxID=1883 RepID=UPI0035709B49
MPEGGGVAVSGVRDGQRHLDLPRARLVEHCPVCARRKRAPALPEARPNLAAQWHPARNNGLTAAKVTAGSHRLVWWKCSVCAGELRCSTASAA